MEVLLAGNTGYVTETFIEESFPECDVVVLGNEMLKSNRKKNILSRLIYNNLFLCKTDSGS